MEYFTFLLGKTTCELIRQIVLSHNGTCRLLNSTTPISLNIFRAQFVGVGQNALSLIALALVTLALMATLYILHARARWPSPPPVRRPHDDRVTFVVPRSEHHEGAKALAAARLKIQSRLRNVTKMEKDSDPSEIV